MVLAPGPALPGRASRAWQRGAGRLGAGQRSAPARSAPAQAGPVQQTFDDLGRPLSDVTFVVVDLETTGGSAATSSITEIGAVKVRGGEVLGEFQTLVRPEESIPPFIAVLTGITNAMVADAPLLAPALTAFLEFSRGAVLVAHNAPFDLGFLRAACDRTGRPWPAYESVDTAVIARRVLTRDEAPNCKLATLARVFRTSTEPCHRALADARATVGVLHGLLERVGNLGVASLEDLKTFSSRVPAAVRRKRHLAETVPSGPGVYMFKDGRGRVLYVGTSGDVRARVRSYFTASEQRSRMAEMVGLAERIDTVPCAHALEAQVRELRLIAEHRPRYNRRSRFPERALYLKLTVEPFPRLSIVRQISDDDTFYLGPLGTRRAAELTAAALHEAVPLRQCTDRLSKRRRSSACVLFGIGRCGAPCEGRQTEEEYAAHVADAVTAVMCDPSKVLAATNRRMAALVAGQRFEEAAQHRDRLAAFVRASARLQRLIALTRIEQLVAAAPDGRGGWEIAVIRHGRLTAAGVAPYGAAPGPYIEALIATAETVIRGPGPTPCATAEETEVIIRWLEAPGVRLVSATEGWAFPAYGAGGRQAWLDAATDRSRVAPFDESGLPRPVDRPAR
jgi:DNA polymerase-3 subunit epsilon